MDHNSFVARRAKLRGLGASDIAKAAGLSPYGGPLDLYLDKCGLKPPVNTPATRWGLKLEEVIAEAYAERTGRALSSLPMPTYTHPLESWVFAHPDRIAFGNGEPARFVELKTARTGEDWGDEETDQVPAGYLCQVQWQMLAAPGIDVVDVAVLIGGSDFRIYTVPRSDEAQELLARIGRDFMDRLERRDPPEPDWTDPKTPELVALLYRPQVGKVVSLGDEAAELADVYKAFGVAKREAEKEQDRAKGRMIELMGDAEQAVLPDGRILERRLVAGCTVAYERSDYWGFSLKKAKEQRCKR